MRYLLKDYSAADQASETASATICSFNMCNWKEFDITVNCSSSSGMEYNIYGSPIDGSGAGILVSGCLNFGKACGTIVTHVINNNLNHFWIEAASTAAAREVTAAHIRVVVTALAEK